MFSVRRSRYFFINQICDTELELIHQCIFFTDIYLLVVFGLFLLRLMLVLWRANRTQRVGE